jgi:hypothetical protein
VFIVTLILILFRVDATSHVHWLDFNKGILILEMHGTNIKIKKDFEVKSVLEGNIWTVTFTTGVIQRLLLRWTLHPVFRTTTEWNSFATAC